MIKWGIWIIGGIISGLILHLVLVLALPGLAARNAWQDIAELDALAKVVVLDQPAAGSPNPLGLDPEVVYAVCRFDLSLGPGVFDGNLPEDFWSIGIFDSQGAAVYSTTNRSGSGTTLQLGIFNPAQTRLLAEQQFEIDEGLLIVESPRNEIYAVVRLALPHQVMRARYAEALSTLRCGHLEDPDAISDSSAPA